MTRIGRGGMVYRVYEESPSYYLVYLESTPLTEGARVLPILLPKDEWEPIAGVPPSRTYSEGPPEQAEAWLKAWKVEPEA